jgi:hypothetical protein
MSDINHEKGKKARCDRDHNYFALCHRVLLL